MRTLRIQTGHIAYRGPDKLDITRKSGEAGLGLPFAPSKAILYPALNARELARQTRREGDHALAQEIEDAAWAVYVPLYAEEMRRSWVKHAAAWDAVFAREHVVLCCYCDGRERCHRGLCAWLLVSAARSVFPAVVDIVDDGEVGATSVPIVTSMIPRKERRCPA